MNNFHTIAKIKKSDADYFKMLSGPPLYCIPEGIDFTEYDPEHKLDSDSWFEITEFSKKGYCLDLLKNPFCSTSYNLLSKNDFTEIEFICNIENGENYFFQKITPSQIISKKVIRLGKVTYETSSTSQNGEDDYVYFDNKTPSEITIKEEPDAIYVRSKDALYFKKLSVIKSIFKGIEVLYQEATEENVLKFIELLPIRLSGKYSVDAIKSENRRRISEATELIEQLTDNQKKELLTVIKEYCPELINENTDEFEINNEKSLKLFLYGVNQRFYTTKFTGEKMIANSVRRIGVKKEN